MNFSDYIRGQRKGKDAHRIEKDAMSDPFLNEAIEGFDSVNDDHMARIENIRKHLGAKSESKTKSQNHIWQTAAAVIVVAALGVYFLADYHKSGLHAQELNNNTIIEIYVPEAYYAENITTIAQKNSEIARAYKPNISRFKIEESEINSREELDIIAEEINKQDETLIEIYVPKDFEKQTLVEHGSENSKPQPIGGYEKYNEYLKKSLRRPTDDICRDRKGKVAVEFSVNSLGQPFLFDVKYSLCGTSDNEAIRLIQSGPRWTTGTERVMVKVEF